MAYHNLRKMIIDRGNDYKTWTALVSPLFKEHYKVIINYLSKPQLLEAEPTAIH